MQRRDFLSTIAASTFLSRSDLAGRICAAEEHDVCHATYASVQDAINSPREEFAFVPAILTGTNSNHPDYLATVDVNPGSPTFGQVVHRLSMPAPGDELHHYGWNACSSCHGERSRRYLIVPGLTSGNLHVVDTMDPTRLVLHKTIPGKQIARQWNL